MTDLAPSLKASWICRALCACAAVALFFSGCDTGPTSSGKLPKTFGIFHWNGTEWERVAENSSITELRPEFLVFDARLGSGLMAPSDTLQLRPAKRITRIVEEMVKSADGPVVGYSTEEVEQYLEDPKTVPLEFRPIGDRRDMLIGSPALDLQSGRYSLRALDAVLSIVVANETPQVPGVEKWYKTVDSGGGFSYDGFFALSQKQMGQERSYNDRPILNISFREAGEFEKLRLQLRREMDAILAADSISIQLPYLAKVRTISPDLHKEASTAIAQKVEQSLKRYQEEGNFAPIVALGKTARDAGLLNAEALSVVHKAEAEERNSLSAEQNKLKWLNDDSEADGTEIARFNTASDSVFRSKQQSFVAITNRYAWEPPDTPYSKPRSMWHGYITEISTGEDKSPWDGRVFYEVTVKYSTATHGGHSEATVRFADKQTQQQFAKALADAKEQWKSESKDYRFSTVLAPVGCWSFPVLVKGSHFRIQSGAVYEVLSDESSPNPVPPDEILTLTGAEWLRFRSKGPQPVKVSVERFP